MAEDEKKEIEVVEGDGSNLSISEVEEHISDLKPKVKDDKKKVIVIPESKEKVEKKKWEKIGQ